MEKNGIRRETKEKGGGVTKAEIYNGDCLEVLPGIPDGSVDLVLADPPFGTMQGFRGITWDVALDPGAMFTQLSRVLRQNGKAVLFAKEPYTARIITEALPALPFAYKAIWKKDRPGNCLTSKKAMVGLYEDICIFSKCGHDYAGGNPNREYFRRVLEWAGLPSARAVNEILGHRRAEHAFYVTEGKKGTGASGSTQFSLCTAETYAEICARFDVYAMPGYLCYNDLKTRENEYISRYAATFNLWQGGRCKTDVLEYKKDPGGLHPTQKPVALMADLVQTFSNPGDVVLDFTMGSGSTGVACEDTGREFIGIELNDNYYNIAADRLRKAGADVVEMEAGKNDRGN